MSVPFVEMPAIVKAKATNHVIAIGSRLMRARPSGAPQLAPSAP